MKEKLAKRGVVIKLRTGTLTATVYEVEDHGIWIQPSGNIHVEGFPGSTKAPIMFVPFYQMEWFGDSNDSG